MWIVTEGVAVVLGLVFLVAAASKLSMPDRFRSTLLLSGMVSAWAVPATRVVVPALELCAGALLVTGLLHPAGPALALLLLAVFTVRAWPIAMSRRASGVLRCSCFGIAGERLDAGLIIRNLLLVGYGVMSLWRPPTRPWTHDPPVPFAPTWVSYLMTLGLLALAPFVLADIVSLWRAAAQLPQLPGLSGFAAEGTSRP